MYSGVRLGLGVYMLQSIYMYILYYKSRYEPISIHLTMLQFYTKL